MQFRQLRTVLCAAAMALTGVTAHAADSWCAQGKTRAFCRHYVGKRLVRDRSAAADSGEGLRLHDRCRARQHGRHRNRARAATTCRSGPNNGPGRSEITAKAVAARQGQAGRRHVAGRHEGRLVRAGIRDQGRSRSAASSRSRRVLFRSRTCRSTKSVFADDEEPDKGRFLNCPTGWDCERVNTRLLKVLNLDASYTNFHPGTGAALDAAIASAYQRGKPMVFYYWDRPR